MAASPLEATVLGVATRELKFIHEQYDQVWAETLTKLLVKIKTAVDAAQYAGQTALPAETPSGFAQRYDDMVEAGHTVNPYPSQPGKALAALCQLRAGPDRTGPDRPTAGVRLVTPD